MAKIKFENGITVNFEGDPTPEDVEEVATSLGLSGKKKTAFTKVKEFGVGVLKGAGETIAGTPFSTVGITGLNKPIGKLPQVKEFLEPKTPAEKAGKITEQVAESLTPLG